MPLSEWVSSGVTAFLSPVGAGLLKVCLLRALSGFHIGFAQQWTWPA